MAGMIAVAQQLRGGNAFGFLNPVLYSLNGSPAYHDITSPASDVVVVRADYANSVDASAGILYSTRRTNTLFTLTSAAGYDDSTGVGTPNGTSFFSALAAK
jgi:hypothetical protein